MRIPIGIGELDSTEPVEDNGPREEKTDLDQTIAHEEMSLSQYIGWSTRDRKTPGKNPIKEGGKLLEETPKTIIHKEKVFRATRGGPKVKAKFPLKKGKNHQMRF